MSENRRRVDRIRSEGYLDGLDALEAAELRARRAETGEEEALLSYERRLLHGRIAILEAELDRRKGGASGSLVDRLKDILSDGTVGGSRGGGNLSDPKIVFDRPSRPTTKLAMDDTLTKLDELSDEQLQQRLEGLKGAEADVSKTRTQILKILDELNAEVARRYASGEINPSDTLSS